MSEAPRPLTNLIHALLDAERHSRGLIEAIAICRCAALDMAKEEGQRKEAPDASKK